MFAVNWTLMDWQEENLIAERRQNMRKVSREEAESIFRLAGFEVKQLWELVNRYWPDSPTYDDVRKPWWLALTDIGLIEMGWRKRVIQIRWDTCPVRAIVTQDDVTKTDTYVHAWSVENAITYLRSLHAHAKV
jgi:hypothetical protein